MQGIARRLPWTQGGHPPFDPVMIFKILVIRTTDNLSDERAEFLIYDWLFCQTDQPSIAPCRRSLRRSSMASIRSSLRSRWTS